MPRQMVFALIEISEDAVRGVHVFEGWEDAKAAFKRWTKVDYVEYCDRHLGTEDAIDILGDFAGTHIWQTHLLEKGAKVVTDDV